MSKRPSRGAQSVRSFLGFWLPIVLLMAAVFWASTKLVEPAPPKHAVIVTGREDGEYYAIAKKYAEVFKKNRIDLEVRPSAGAVQNWDALLKPDGDVDLAIVQGGTLPANEEIGEKIEGVASLYLEPLWVFYHDDQDLDRLSQLAGRMIAIGPDGSGTQLLANQLLLACGISSAKPTVSTVLVPLGTADAAQALINGKIDAALFVAAPTSPVVQNLLTARGIKLMSFSQAGALSRTYPYLSAVTLYRGSIDLAKDLPAHDVQLIAPAAMLVARESAHKSLVLLGAMAATQFHKGGTLLNEPGKFPTSRFIEVPMAKEAQHFLDSGPSIMQRIFPFWLSSFLDRILIMFLPLAALLIPIVRFTPPLYVWRTRSRIYRWYKQIRAIDEQMGPDAQRSEMEQSLVKVQQIDDEVRSVHVPLSYMEELYHLRMHLNLLEQKLRQRSGR